MNRTLLSAILVTALTAMNCFAAETQEAAGTATGPDASLPVASQALANPAPPAQKPRAVGSAVVGKAEKMSPIVEAASRQDGIAPQKSQFEEAALTKQPPQTQTANASADGDKSSACRKKTFKVELGNSGMKLLSQGKPTSVAPQLRNQGSSSEQETSTTGGCKSCKKKKLMSGDNTTTTETTK